MSMTVLDQIFPTVADMMDSCPGFDGNKTFQQINSSAISARKLILDIITKPIWDKIAAETDSDELIYLRVAFANLTMYKDGIFHIIDERKSTNTTVYKYEYEQMKRQYIDNYYNALDSLIAILEADTDKYQWAETHYAKLRESLKIRTAMDFNTYYPIDTSFLYFFRTIPLQRQILNEFVSDYYDKISARTDLLERLNSALVKLTVASSLTKFDIIEFPPTMRSLFDDNTANRSGKDEQTAIERVAAGLTAKATDILNNIDMVLTDPATNIDTGTNFNEESNPYYFMG